MLTEEQLDHTGEPTLPDVSEALTAAYGTDFGVQPDLDLPVHRHDAAGSSPTGRAGCCWRAMPPTHAPTGGQGMNTECRMP